MDRITKEVIKEAKDRLIIVEWIDAYDSSEELDITDITLVKQVYETSGFFVEIKNDHMIIGYNREVPFKNVYKGYGAIPVALVTNVAIMDRNCR